MGCKQMTSPSIDVELSRCISCGKKQIDGNARCGYMEEIEGFKQLLKKSDRKCDNTGQLLMSYKVKLLQL